MATSDKVKIELFLDTAQAEKMMTALSAKSKKTSKQVATAFEDINTKVAGTSFTITNTIKGMMATVGASLSAYGAKSFIEYLIAPSREMEKFRLQFWTLYKSLEDARGKIQELLTFALVTPYELGEVIKAQRMLKIFGIDSVRMLTAVGDAAAGTGHGFEEVARWVGRLATGITGRPLWRLSEMAIVTRRMLEMEGLEFDKTGSFRGSIKRLLETVQRLMEERFGGYMKEAAKTFDGLANNILDSLYRIRLVAAVPVFATIKKEMSDWFNFMVDSIQTGAIKVYVYGFAMAVDTITKKLISFGKFLWDKKDTISGVFLIGLVIMTGKAFLRLGQIIYITAIEIYTAGGVMNKGFLAMRGSLVALKLSFGFLIYEMVRFASSGILSTEVMKTFAKAVGLITLALAALSMAFRTVRVAMLTFVRSIPILGQVAIILGSILSIVMDIYNVGKKDIERRETTFAGYSMQGLRLTLQGFKENRERLQDEITLYENNLKRLREATPVTTAYDPETGIKIVTQGTTQAIEDHVKKLGELRYMEEETTKDIEAASSALKKKREMTTELTGAEEEWINKHPELAAFLDEFTTADPNKLIAAENELKKIRNDARAELIEDEIAKKEFIARNDKESAELQIINLHHVLEEHEKAGLERVGTKEEIEAQIDAITDKYTKLQDAAVALSNEALDHRLNVERIEIVKRSLDQIKELEDAAEKEREDRDNKTISTMKDVLSIRTEIALHHAQSETATMEDINKYEQQALLDANTLYLTGKENASELEAKQSAAQLKVFQVTNRVSDMKVALWRKEHAFAINLAESFVSGFRAAFYAVIDTAKTTTEKLQAIWQAFRDAVVGMLLDIAAKVIMVGILSAITGIPFGEVAKASGLLGYQKGGILPKGTVGFFEGTEREIVAPESDFLSVMKNLVFPNMLQNAEEQGVPTIHITNDMQGALILADSPAGIDKLMSMFEKGLRRSASRFGKQ